MPKLAELRRIFHDFFVDSVDANVDPIKNEWARTNQPTTAFAQFALSHLCETNCTDAGTAGVCRFEVDGNEIHSVNAPALLF